jgi:hypothetical protein
MNNVIVDVAAAVQGPVAFAVNVNTTDPLAISLVPGVYVAPAIVASLKAPSPAVVQSTELWLEAVPGKVYVASSQIVASGPAPARGNNCMNNVILDVAAVTQGPVAFAVRVNITEPFAISFGPGVYVAPRIEASSNDPSPPLVHNEEL